MAVCEHVQVEQVDQQLAALADEIERRLGGSAAVRRVEHSPTWSGVHVEPRSSGAARVSWFYGEGLQVQVGSGVGGGRFEIDTYDLEDAAFIRAVVESAIAGRVVERFRGDHWSLVEVTLGDGRVVRESGGGHPPWPLSRRQRTVEYLPYLAADEADRP